MPFIVLILLRIWGADKGARKAPVNGHTLGVMGGVALSTKTLRIGLLRDQKGLEGGPNTGS